MRKRRNVAVPIAATFNAQTNMEQDNASAETDRVRRHTSQQVLDEVDERIAQSIRFYATQPDAVIRQRIEELDREWDMERRLETNASVAVVASTVLGLTFSKKWFLLTAAVGGFLFQHAVAGWCPPVPILRRLGARTRKEIDREKFALKALRGDFKGLSNSRKEQKEQNPEVVARTLQAVNS